MADVNQKRGFRKQQLVDYSQVAELHAFLGRVGLWEGPHFKLSACIAASSFYVG